MANLEELKRRLAERSNRGKSTGDKKDFPKVRWYPTTEHTIRVLPLGKNPLNDSLIEVEFHYNMGSGANASLLCSESEFLAEKKENCPINKFAKQLWSYNDADGKKKSQEQKDADFAVFRKIQSQVKFACQIVERGKEDEGAKWWVFPEKIFKKLSEICDSGPNKRLCGIGKEVKEAGYAVLVGEKAFDLVVSKQLASNKDGKGNNTMYDTIEITLANDGDTVPLAVDKKSVEKILASIKPFTEAYPFKDAHVLGKLLEGYMKETYSKEKTVEELEAEPGVEYKSNSTDDITKTGSKLAEEAMEELMNA